MQPATSIFRDDPTWVYWLAVGFTALFWALFVLIKGRYLEGLAVRKPPQKIKLTEIHRSDPTVRERLARIQLLQYRAWGLGLLSTLMSVGVIWLGLAYALDTVRVDDRGFVINQNAFFAKTVIAYSDVREVSIVRGQYIDRGGVWRKYTQYVFKLRDGREKTIPLDEFLGRSFEQILIGFKNHGISVNEQF